ncbi:MAG: hypothetical protein JRN15_09695 [Nitrososphaerota archaeon]|nr:hypothetical protein [Nitrososphaerota archaeon]
MKPIPLELRTDTLRDLNSVANQLGIPRVELIRRSVEVALLLGGVSLSEISDLLLESLHENERMLSEESVDRSKLSRELAKSAFFSAALCSISLVNEGKERSNVLEMYFQAIRSHSIALGDPKIKLKDLELSAVKQDIVSFSNLLRKFEEQRASERNEEK